MLENVPSLDRFFAQSKLRQYETVARRLWRDQIQMSLYLVR